MWLMIAIARKYTRLLSFSDTSFEDLHSFERSLRTAQWLENFLDYQMDLLFEEEGIDRRAIKPLQRMNLIRYQCPVCKLLPLYLLDLSHIKKARCGKCGQLVSFKSSGKYGKMRKKIAVRMWRVIRYAQ